MPQFSGNVNGMICARGGGGLNKKAEELKQ